MQNIDIPDELYYYHSMNDTANENAIMAQFEKQFIEKYGNLYDSSLFSNPLSETSLNNVVSISPNPTNGVIEISFNNLNEDETVDCFIIDMMGKTIQQRKALVDEQNKIDLTDESSGVYFVKLVSSYGRSIVKRIVKK